MRESDRELAALVRIYRELPELERDHIDKLARQKAEALLRSQHPESALWPHGRIQCETQKKAAWLWASIIRERHGREIDSARAEASDVDIDLAQAMQAHRDARAKDPSYRRKTVATYADAGRLIPSAPAALPAYDAAPEGWEEGRE